MFANQNSFVLKPAFRKLYYALEQSHLLYGLAIRGFTLSSYLSKLASLRNKAIRLGAGSKYRDHVTGSFCILN